MNLTMGQMRAYVRRQTPAEYQGLAELCRQTVALGFYRKTQVSNVFDAVCKGFFHRHHSSQLGAVKRLKQMHWLSLERLEKQLDHALEDAPKEVCTECGWAAAEATCYCEPCLQDQEDIDRIESYDHLVI